MLQDAIRVAAASITGMVVGAFYYNVEVNPLARIWFKENYPQLAGNYSSVQKALGDDYERIPIAATMICVIILSLCVNQYVNLKQIRVGRLIQMSVELTLMVICLQLPHTLFASHSIRAFAVDQLYNFMVVITVTFVLGYNRFDEDYRLNTPEPKKRGPVLELEEDEDSDQHMDEEVSSPYCIRSHIAAKGYSWSCKRNSVLVSVSILSDKLLKKFYFV